MTSTKKVLVITIDGDEEERVNRYSEIIQTQVKAVFSHIKVIQQGSSYRNGTLAPLHLQIEMQSEEGPALGPFTTSPVPLRASGPLEPSIKSYGPWPLRLTCIFLLATTLFAVFQNAHLVKQFQETTQDYIVGHQQMLRTVRDHGAALRCVAWGK
jgi:hypothetical protein